jgi:hypothetical protein
MMMEKLKYSAKTPVPVPLCPLQIPHGTVWDLTWASVVMTTAADFDFVTCPCTLFYTLKICKHGKE